MIAFKSSTLVEWFDVDTVARILRCTPQRVLELIQNGTLRARSSVSGHRIDSSSLDAFSATRPLMGRPEPETYVKVGGKVYREV